MAIIAGVNIPDNKRLAIALTKLYGIGPTNSKRIVNEVGLGHDPRVRALVRVRWPRTGRPRRCLTPR